MYNTHKFHLYSQVFVEVSNHSTVELGSIVRDSGSKESVSAYNLVPVETTHSFCLDFGYNLCFYSFCKVFDSYYLEIHLTWHQGGTGSKCPHPIGWKDMEKLLTSEVLPVHGKDQYVSGVNHIFW